MTSLSYDGVACHMACYMADHMGPPSQLSSITICGAFVHSKRIGGKRMEKGDLAEVEHLYVPQGPRVRTF